MGFGDRSIEGARRAQNTSLWAFLAGGGMVAMLASFTWPIADRLQKNSGIHLIPDEVFDFVGPNTFYIFGGGFVASLVGFFFMSGVFHRVLGGGLQREADALGWSGRD